MSKKTVLVANRGEVALRIQRACRSLGHRVVQVYSEADRDSLPVQMADQSVCIGKPASTLSYLNPIAILGAAKLTGADAIHPGYGFLSERAEFAERVRAEGLVFVGPSAQSISLMGEKSVARDMAMKAGVPTVPGSQGLVLTVDQAAGIAKEIGYPVLLKATAGGGGRGMRVVERETDLAKAFQEASAEAELAFGDRGLYLEKYLRDPRHIEVQVLSDGHSTVTLGERDCSAQRRRQKIIEEAPSPGIAASMREPLLEAARCLAQAIQYENAGTVEFIVSGSDFYFMEMNTRIQVEHPVTEVLTGVDLVAEQLEIAFGRRLSGAEKNLPSRGHALECRINAEDPSQNFRPSPGRLTSVHFPSGPWVRLDSHCFPGYVVPPFYDSMIAKLIVWGRNREEAIRRALQALSEVRLEGIKTNVEFLKALLVDPAFQAGQMHTQYVEREMLVGSS
jgi:acetyl-CoA carboxylase, biotin carboxylase subunit